jgi:hypothetical protein
MPFESPDIEVFKQNLDTTIGAIQKQRTDSHSAIKIQSLLNLTVYVMATRFLEASVKHIVFNCCKMKGYSQTQLVQLEQTLKKFNNPEFKNIKALFDSELGYDIEDGLRNRHISGRDISFLNQIVQNRHRNVHATPDSSEWYNQNQKDLSNFIQEYPGLLNIIEYLDSLQFTNSSSNPQRIITPTNNGSNVMANTQSTSQTIQIKKTLRSWLKSLFS